MKSMLWRIADFQIHANLADIPQLNGVFTQARPLAEIPDPALKVRPTYKTGSEL